MEPVIKFPAAQLPVTEDSLAVLFVNEYAHKAVFDHHSGKWFVWDGNRWKKNETRLPLQWCRELCRNMAVRDEKVAKTLGKAATIKGVETLAQIDPKVACTSGIFDSDTMLLGTPQGTVDLKTGAVRRADQGDFITRSTAIGPAQSNEKPERWLSFLHQATGGDQDMIRFLQKVAGYALTGNTEEHALFFVFGPGGNGKSVFLMLAAV